MRHFLPAFVLSLALSAPAQATDKAPIKILDLSSYTVGAAFTTPNKQGFEMAAEEINAKGGVLGRPIEFLHVDDTGKPDQAITKLQQIFSIDQPVLVTGCNLANIELAISSYAKQNKILQISSCTNGNDSLWKLGHDYTYRGTGPMVYSFNWTLAERAATKGKLKWAAVNHSYAWGQENYASFKENLAKFTPNATWIAEQWTPIGKIDAGSVVNAINRSGADAVYTSLWGTDLINFLKEARKRGLLNKVMLVCEELGRPETMEQLASEFPSGVIVNGILPAEYPVTPAMKAFADRYQEKYKQSVRYTALQAYLSAQTMARAIEKAGSTETADLIKALNGLAIPDSIFGSITIRAIDNVADNGVWVGETALKDGKPIIVNVEYKDGKNYFPPDNYIEGLRK